MCMCTLAAASCFYPPLIRQPRSKSALPYVEFAGNRLSEHIGLLEINNQFKKHPVNSAKNSKLNTSILRMSTAAADHLRSLFYTAIGRLAERDEVNQGDIKSTTSPKMDLLLCALVMAYYPNVGHVK